MNPSGSENLESKKLEKHLSLLRDEYVKLQNRLFDHERKYETLVAAQGGDSTVQLSEKSFVSRLLRKVSDLFEKDLFSDITVHLDGHQVRAHRFVLSARSDTWGVPDLSSAECLRFDDIQYNIGITLLRWVYTDQLDPKLGDCFVVDLMKASKRFHLDDLLERCEFMLIARLDVTNCIQFFQTADQLKLENLKEKCSYLITARWDEFTGTDFSAISAPLLYKMLKGKSTYPLHAAINLQREDVVFLYLIEYSSQLPDRINERNGDGKLPLSLALATCQEAVAKTLVSYKADVNARNSNGKALLIDAIESGNEFACKFLIDNGADVNAIDESTGKNCLYLICGMEKLNSSAYSATVNIPPLFSVAESLLDKNINVNALDTDRNSCLHLCIANKNEKFLTLLINHPKSSASINLNVSNKENCPPLCLAQILIDKGADFNAVDSISGNTLLHRCIESGAREAAEFLLKIGANTQTLNKKGESILHLASRQGMSELVAKFLSAGADPNLPTETGLSPDNHTPLNLAILNQRRNVLKALLDFEKNDSKQRAKLKIDCLDSEGETLLSVALFSGLIEFAKDLVNVGANVNHKTCDGLSLLHRTILAGKEESAIFLIDSRCDLELKTADGSTPLIDRITRISVYPRHRNTRRQMALLSAPVFTRP